MPDDIRDVILDEIKPLWKSKGICRFISTHPDDDHICGLADLDGNLGILNFYCVKNDATKAAPTSDFEHYCSLRDSDKIFNLHAGCSRKWMNQKNDNRGSAGINILWPITKNHFFKEALKIAADSGSPNNISPIIKYSMNDGVTVLWFGDLENDFMENVKDEVDLPSADIVFAPHHGRNSGKLPNRWLDQISPQIIVIGEATSNDLHYYDGYNTITQNSAGDITFECGDDVDVYVSNEEYSVDFLHDCGNSDTYGYYIGSLQL